MVFNLLMLPFWEFKYRILRVLRFYVGVKNYSQFEAYRKYPDYLKFGGAVNYIINVARPHLSGKGLDIGCSIWPIEGARAVDYTEEEHAAKLLENDGSIDYIFASHLIEHVTDPTLVFNEWNRVLREEGTLFLYVPHPSCEMWQKANNGFHLWNPDFQELKYHLENHGFKVVSYSETADAYLSFYINAKKIKTITKEN